MSDAPAPTRAEEGRELPSDADFLRETVKVVEWQRDNARQERNEEYARAAQAEAEVARLTQERDEALCLAEGPGTLLDLARGSVSRGMELHAAEAEVARLTAAVAISEIAVRSLQARAAAFERALKVRHPLTGKDASAWLVLADLAAQEGCDGEPYDTMQAVADALRATLTGGDR